MRPAPRPALLWRRSVVPALCVLAALASCGGDSDRSDANLSALDTRLTNSAVVGNAASPDGDGATSTLGSLARSQQASGGGGSAAPRARINGECASNVQYGDQWARAMPAAFDVYPGGRLVEAAGIDDGRCALRVVSFTTAAAPDDVIRHYQASARNAGYDAEQQLCQGEHLLGGTRSTDGAAYMLYARRMPGGMTEVDIIAGDSV